MYGIYSVPCEVLPPATNFSLSVILLTRLHLQPSTSWGSRFGVNMLGGKAAPWTFSLIPHQSESEAVYTEAYHASRRATRAVMALPLCGNSACATCKAIDIVCTNETVRCCLNGRPYKANHELPVSYGLSDNTETYQNFLKHCLNLLAELCQTHATCNSGVQRNAQKVFRQFRNV